MNHSWSPSPAFSSLRGAHQVPSSSLLFSSTFLLRPNGKISSIWSLGHVSVLAKNPHRETHNLLATLHPYLPHLLKSFAGFSWPLSKGPTGAWHQPEDHQVWGKWKVSPPNLFLLLHPLSLRITRNLGVILESSLALISHFQLVTNPTHCPLNTSPSDPPHHLHGTGWLQAPSFNSRNAMASSLDPRCLSPNQA